PATMPASTARTGGVPTSVTRAVSDASRRQSSRMGSRLAPAAGPCGRRFDVSMRSSRVPSAAMSPALPSLRRARARRGPARIVYSFSPRRASAGHAGARPFPPLEGMEDEGSAIPLLEGGGGERGSRWLQIRPLPGGRQRERDDDAEAGGVVL